MKTNDPRRAVERVIRRLGFPVGRLGTQAFVEAVLLCLREPQALTAVTKEVYPRVAKLSNTSGKNVEHNMRTARDRVWRQGDLELLNEMAGFQLRLRPSVGELLNYIAGYIRDEGLLEREDL